MDSWVSTGRTPRPAPARRCRSGPWGAPTDALGPGRGGDGPAARCRLALTYAQPVIDQRCHALLGQTLYASLLRVGNEALVNTYFSRNPANASPVLHLRRQGDNRVDANTQRSFERVQASAASSNVCTVS